MELEQNNTEAFIVTDDITTYIKQARKYPILSRDEEMFLACAAKNGDRLAVKKLVESNLLLVVKIAHEYRSVFNNLNDLIQEGNVGLLRSVDKYDASKGFRVSTYAGWWIRSMMLRYIFNNSHMIKPGTTNEQKKLFYNLRKEQRRLEDMGIDADAATIAQNLDVSEEDVIEMDGRLRNDIYLDSPIAQEDDDDSHKSFSNCISSAMEERPDIVAENNNFRSMLRDKLDAFAKKLKNDRCRDIFYKRIVAEDPLTLQQLGDNFGITKERTRQIEEEITINLRKHLKSCTTF